MSLTDLGATTRRALWQAGTGLALACALPAWARDGAADPFTLGVASGDPVSDGFVIWTRLAPDPLAPDGSGGMSGSAPVRWEVAGDAAFRQPIAHGVVQADARYAHSVHVEVAGLKPNRPYWYRFAAMGALSPVGAARTAPGPHDPLARFRFAFLSCSHWEEGWFSAYRRIAEERPDLVVFLGDYIYEYNNQGRKLEGRPRRHVGPEATDLPTYRNRYALYRTDPDLQALHAAAPSLQTWDDHEVENDYANAWSENPNVSPKSFLKRRADAYQAFYEHMPLRARSRPHGPDMRVYDRFRFGDLIEMPILDGRQYRNGPQPCPEANGWRGGHVASPSCHDFDDPKRTMLGFAQERWLIDGFRRSNARWTIVAQDLLMAGLIQTGRDGAVGHWTDGWDGYRPCRARVLEGVRDAKVRNPVFIGGDIHSFWTTDLKVDFDRETPTVATEFVGGSITADAPPYEVFARMLPRNPHVKFFESRAHGYVSCDVTPTRMDVQFMSVDRLKRDAPGTVLARFAVEDGRPGAVAA